MLIPSIDLMNSKAVKLIQGNPKNKAFEEDALALALKFSVYPEINLIDLDAAFGKGDNIELIKKICRICNCNVGGGIRSMEKAYDFLKAGANKLIIGTSANVEFLSKLPKERLIVAVDSRNGVVTDNGWKNQRSETPFEMVKKLTDYCSGFLYTYVDKEGTMEEVDFKTVKKLREMTDKKIMYAGGVSGNDDVARLAELNVDCVVGMAYYENKIVLEESFASLIDFNKNNGLIPTIVKDELGQVLMLAYSTRESLIKALSARKGIYFSRSRKKLWEKGETSGNIQELLRVQIDCDKDTLLFTVKQTNVACHTGSYSCFDDKEFSLGTLLSIIESRKGTGSFTDKLLQDEKILKEKILEEANEVINFKNKDNLRWEIADLLYFISILMVKNNLDYDDIENELSARDIMKKLIKTTKLG